MGGLLGGRIGDGDVDGWGVVDLVDCGGADEGSKEWNEDGVSKHVGKRVKKEE